MVEFNEFTALIVVDLQNDFADPAGSLHVSGGDRLVPLINTQIERAIERGAPIFYTQDWHPPDTPHFAKDGGVWPVHCVRETWGAQLHPDLTLVGPVVRKGANGEDGYSGFTMRNPQSMETVPTELASLLAAASVREVVLCGLATDYCVKATALDARAHGYPTIVLADAIAAVDLQPGDGARAVSEMLAAGVALSTAVPSIGTD